MTIDWQDKTRLLLGKKHDEITDVNILIVGLGGVGESAAEMICRAGISKMTIVDGDKIDLTNINRQILTTHRNIGKSKAKIVAQKMLEINPDLKINIIDKYIEDFEMRNLLETDIFDYVIDAIDTLAPKIQLINHCMQLGIKIVSSMGAGGKLNPSKVQVADISESYNCKLARFVRKKLHKRGIRTGFKVVFSAENIVRESLILKEDKNKKSDLGTISYMPNIFGIYAAWVVIDEFISK